MQQFFNAVSIWVLPALISITMHEAAHGYVANLLGDDTAKKLGRVTLNPFKHIDIHNTIRTIFTIYDSHQIGFFSFHFQFSINETTFLTTKIKLKLL